MDSIPWYEILETRHTVMDDDHRKLVELLNRLAAGVKKRKAAADCLKLLDEIIEHTKSHFELEQRLMAQHHYPSAGQHAAEHSMLINQAEDYRATLDLDAPGAHTALMHFAEVWLSFHILFSDKELAQFLAKRA
jgi:hemerythrin-like metal-binding protein